MAQALMQSQWSICPPDILKRCFCTQLDYVDNAAAACVCKLWRETFRAGGPIIKLEYGTLRSQPDPLYLHQFANVTTVTLTALPIAVGSKHWLSDEADSNQQHTGVSNWIETMQTIPATCTKLTLDRHLPGTGVLHSQMLTDPFRQLSSLQHLKIQGRMGAKVEVEALSGLTNLEVFEASCRRRDSAIGLGGSLQALPASISRLKLCGCEMQDQEHVLGGPDTRVVFADLAHLKLRDLDLSHSTVVFGHAGSLPLLTRLIFNHTMASNGIPVDVLATSALRVLCIRDSAFVGFGEDPVGLGDLLSHFSCLQELDIINCDGVRISPRDCEQVQLASLAFSYSQLSDPDNSCLKHFVVNELHSSGIRKPYLRMDDGLPCDDHRLISMLPLAALQHLTISIIQEWPGMFSILDESCWQCLAVLDVRFATSHDASIFSTDRAIVLDSRMRLRELYIADSSYLSYDLAQCTTLRVVGIIQKGPRKPALHLPPFLTNLTLHNILSRSTDLGLAGLSDLTSIKLGGRVAGIDVTRQLPCLPKSTTELDLWDGLLTDLQHLTRLTNLKKLLMPDPPTEHQLQIIRQLRQLRHLDVTGRAGMPCYSSTSATVRTSHAVKTVTSLWSNAVVVDLCWHHLTKSHSCCKCCCCSAMLLELQSLCVFHVHYGQAASSACGDK